MRRRKNVSNQRPLKTIVCIQHESTRIRCLQHLRELQAGNQLPGYVIDVTECNSPEEVLQLLHLHYETSPASAALLISDLLAESSGTFPNEECRPTSWAMEILHEFEDRLFGTMAIMDRSRRVPDIDRVLWRNFDGVALLNMLTLVADKLTYITRPERSLAPVQRDPVTVRPIKDKAELQSYFRLRYRVYRVMGYLEPRVENASSGMEMDSCDTHALHIGAFVRDGAGEKLVGTTRVVSLEPLDNRYESWTRSLARTDPVLNTRLDLYDPMGLPIFQSMRLNDKIAEVLTQDRNCGELSRVIVTEDFRGRGLSELLVWFAVLQAVNKGVGQLLLECLPVHERLYRKFGFTPMRGVTGRVIGVDKTMVAMELNPLAVEQMRKQPSVGRFLQLMRDQGYLQSCHDNSCGQAECDLYTKGKCPPR
jgi:predicted GNAT family N-acyltransferase